MRRDLEEQPEDHIEERIRLLEALIFRTKQRQKWRRQSHTPIQKITNIAGELLIKADNLQDEGGVPQEKVGVDVEGGTVEGEKIGKRKASYLVAKALGMETYTNGVGGCNENFFDCNICLKMARDPVLTCCGHLFCWSCFYPLSYAYSNAKECPVCLGEVFETDLTPVYGNASANGSGRMESKETGSTIPARPNASRIESIRLQRRSHRDAASTDQDMSFFDNLHVLEDAVQMEILNNLTD